MSQTPSTYAATGLTGGPSCLDAIDVTTPDIYNSTIVLQDGDTATVITNTWTYHYTYDADSGLAESSPGVIKPDYSNGEAYSGAGRWIMIPDWTGTDKNLVTTGDITGNDITGNDITGNDVTGTLHGATDSVLAYNQGDAHAQDTTISAKLQTQLVADTDYTSLALAVSDIGSVTPTKLRICGNNVIADGTTITFSRNITPDFTCGGSINGSLGGGGETLVIQGDMIVDTSHQIFGDNLGTVTINDPGIIRDPRWFGAVADKATSDIVAWQRLFASFTSEGGIFHVPDGTYLGNAAGTQIIWPNDGSKCYPITIRGDAAMPTSGTYGSSGGSEVKYDGAGTLFDATNGNDTILDWKGCRIEGVRWSNANPYTAGSVFLKMGDFTEGAIVNNYIIGFETGVWWLRYGYYSLFHNNYVGYCYRGIYAQDSTDAGATTNGLTFAWNRIANNTIGVEIVRGGSPVTLTHNWIENNTTYGLLATNCRSILSEGDYYENNGTETSLKITSDPLNSTQFTMLGGRIYHSSERYAITFDYVPSVCILGTEIDTGFDGGQALRWLHGTSRGMIAANFGPRSNNTRLMSRSLTDGMISGGSEIPIVSTGYAEGKYVENRITGDWLLNSFQLAGHGNKLGEVVTVPGAGSSVAALAGITATTTAASSVVTFDTTPSYLHPGSTITIVGETFTDEGVSRSYARIAEFTSNTVASIHGVADVGVAGAAVAWNPVTKLNAYGIQLADEGTNVPTSGIVETTFTTYTMAAGIMGATGRISLHNNGTKSGAVAGTLTLTYYVGATAHAMPTISTNDDWILDVRLRNESASSQNYDWVLLVSHATTHVTTTYSGHEEASVNTANETIFKLTGTCSNAGDTGTSRHSTWYVPPY